MAFIGKGGHEEIQARWTENKSYSGQAPQERKVFTGSWQRAESVCVFVIRCTHPQDALSPGDSSDISSFPHPAMVPHACTVSTESTGNILSTCCVPAILSAYG